MQGKYKMALAWNCVRVFKLSIIPSNIGKLDGIRAARFTQDLQAGMPIKVQVFSARGTLAIMHRSVIARQGCLDWFFEGLFQLAKKRCRLVAEERGTCNTQHPVRAQSLMEIIKTFVRQTMF